MRRAHGRYGHRDRPGPPIPSCNSLLPSLLEQSSHSNLFLFFFRGGNCCWEQQWLSKTALGHVPEDHPSHGTLKGHLLCVSQLSPEMLKSFLHIWPASPSLKNRGKKTCENKSTCKTLTLGGGCETDSNIKGRRLRKHSGQSSGSFVGISNSIQMPYGTLHNNMNPVFINLCCRLWLQEQLLEIARIW